MNYQQIPDPPEHLKELVLKGLRLFNRAANPSFYAKLDDPKTREPLNLFAFKDDQSLAGGLLGFTQLTWLKTEILVVEENERNRGIGAELMRRAESEALARGCNHAYVDTMAWQARGFYQKLGYHIAGELPDWDSHGNSKFFLIKRLQRN